MRFEHSFYPLAGLLMAAVLSASPFAHAQSSQLPESLVVRFGEGSAELDQPAVREAIASELGVPVALEGGEHAATLTIERASSGEVRVGYRPTREAVTRSVPVTAGTDVATLIAHLAGNLVRNEARDLLAGMAPPPAPQALISTPAAVATPVDQGIPTQKPRPAPYLDNAWILSVLAGGVIRGDEQLQLTLQFSRRLGCFELGAGARLGYGRVDATVLPLEGVSDDRRVSSYQLTLPLSLEYRVLGRDEAYWQLGGYVGYRFAGIMNQSASVASGSDGDFNFGLQTTVGFRLAPTHGLMARFAWDLTPETHSVGSGDGDYEVDALAPVVQIGWQIGW